MLTKLRYLNLSHNNLEFLPDELWKMSSLTYLGLSSTSLQTLPGSIMNLRSLQVLDLSNNDLLGLPFTIVHLRKVLHVLNLCGNPNFAENMNKKLLGKIEIYRIFDNRAYF